jgi:molybdopterin synthase catalytic subunit
MANPVCEVLLTDAQLKVTQEDADLGPPGAGAVLDFWGVVRGAEDGREIDGIQYEAHQAMAEHQLRRIAQQAIEKFALNLIVIHHRVGFIAPGEPSLFLRVASRHRAEAFRASQWAVDELKRKVPIWKHPKYKIDNQPARKGKFDLQAEAHLISRG